ncbi:hypothetical protein MYK68_16070 [Gordonia sp. PP30]|uniref:hypothetical protein n=1 Tax=Gordonia sp. PP30 TaxID=2935861 RepID=UPI001FFE6447|nr:hypothetical protein [Gordonia sp. PP30]UQE74228.1 hypothetical protein MYK68_16070 [Gordonia sp. PP30]
MSEFSEHMKGVLDSVESIEQDKVVVERRIRRARDICMEALMDGPSSEHGLAKEVLAALRDPAEGVR